MAQYISKDAALAMIEELESQNNCGTDDFIESKRIAYKQVKEGILEMKEIDSMQECPTTSVWHDANIRPVKDEKHLWVVVSLKNGDIYTCFVSTLVRWQDVQLDAIECWAYREDLLKL